MKQNTASRYHNTICYIDASVSLKNTPQVIFFRITSRDRNGESCEILLLPLEHKIHSNSPPCNILYEPKEIIDDPLLNEYLNGF